MFGVGLMGLVASTRGITEAGHMAQILVLVTPVQLASQTLPMLTLHRLAAAALVGPRAFRAQWLWDLRLYVVLAALGFGGLFVIYDIWVGLVLGPSGTQVPWLATTMCGLGLLFSSWAGNALWACQSARNLLAGNILAALGMFTGVLLKVPTLYLVAVPYWVATGGHAALVWWWLQRAANPSSPVLSPAIDLVPAEPTGGKQGWHGPVNTQSPQRAGDWDRAGQPQLDPRAGRRIVDPLGDRGEQPGPGQHHTRHGCQQW